MKKKEKHYILGVYIFTQEEQKELRYISDTEYFKGQKYSTTCNIDRAVRFKNKYKLTKAALFLNYNKRFSEFEIITIYKTSESVLGDDLLNGYYGSLLDEQGKSRKILPKEGEKDYTEKIKEALKEVYNELN